MATAWKNKAAADESELVSAGVKFRRYKLWPGWSAEWMQRKGKGKGWKAQSKRASQYRAN